MTDHNAPTDENAQGVDSDGDGVRNACDNCRFSRSPTQIDGDADRAGNAGERIVSPNRVSPRRWRTKGSLKVR